MSDEKDLPENHEDSQENETEHEETLIDSDEIDLSIPQSSEAEAELKAELATTKDQLLRALADVENIRRRAQKEKEETAQYAVTSFARDLLSVADNLKLAINSAGDQSQEQASQILEGVKITEKELLKVFEKHKIKQVEALDQPFNPEFHQAMLEIDGSGKPAGTVVQEMQTGYTISDRLLRPAMVGVSK